MTEPKLLWLCALFCWCASCTDRIDGLPPGLESFVSAVVFVQVEGAESRAHALDLSTTNRIDVADAQSVTVLAYDASLSTLRLQAGPLQRASSASVRRLPAPDAMFAPQGSDIGDGDWVTPSSLDPTLFSFFIEETPFEECVMEGGCYSDDFVDLASERWCFAPCPVPGAIDAPLEPTPPIFTPCPDGWTEIDDGEGLRCQRPTFANCPEGNIKLPSGACFAETECVDGQTFASDLPSDAVFVLADAPEGGDGSREMPYTTIQRALDDGREVIAIGRGRYLEIFTILRRRASLVGACAKETIIGRRSETDDAIVQAGNATVSISGITLIEGGYRATRSVSTLRDLSIRSSSIGIQQDGGSIDATRLIIEDVRVPIGIYTGAATVSQVAVESFGRTYVAVFLTSGSTLTVSDLSIRFLGGDDPNALSHGLVTHPDSWVRLDHASIEGPADVLTDLNGKGHLEDLQFVNTGTVARQTLAVAGSHTLERVRVSSASDLLISITRGASVDIDGFELMSERATHVELKVEADTRLRRWYVRTPGELFFDGFAEIHLEDLDLEVGSYALITSADDLTMNRALIAAPRADFRSYGHAQLEDIRINAEAPLVDVPSSSFLTEGPVEGARLYLDHTVVKVVDVATLDDLFVRASLNSVETVVQLFGDANVVGARWQVEGSLGAFVRLQDNARATLTHVATASSRPASDCFDLGFTAVLEVSSFSCVAATGAAGLTRDADSVVRASDGRMSGWGTPFDLTGAIIVGGGAKNALTRVVVE